MACRSIPVVASLLAATSLMPGLLAAEPGRGDFAGLAEEYGAQVRPAIQEFCLGCHSTQLRTGELDLERFATLAEVRRDTKAWLKVAEMLDNGEMPPKAAKQPRPTQRKKLSGRSLLVESTLRGREGNKDAMRSRVWRRRAPTDSELSTIAASEVDQRRCR